MFAALQQAIEIYRTEYVYGFIAWLCRCRSDMVNDMEIQGESKQTEGPLLVAAAVIFAGEKVLITRRPDDKRHPGFWEFPGGKVNCGESPEQALCREIREELDAEVRVERIYEVVYHCYDWGPVLILAYQCQLITDRLRNLGVAEHRWVLPTDMMNFKILPADQPIIDRLAAGVICNQPT